jgi:hypothetical protein
MVKLNREAQANVNVTLADRAPKIEALDGKEFPCPVCGTGLAILLTKNQKPYCVCNDCGVQLFVRGKPGISRLIKIAKDGVLVSGIKESASYGINLYNRLQQLKLQKEELKNKQGLFLRDENLTNAISLLDGEIEATELELEKLAKNSGPEGKK